MSKITKPCMNCSKDVTRYKSQMLKSVYCSRECRSEYFRKHKNVTLNCDFCKSEYTVRSSSVKGNSKNYCSRKCKDSHQTKLLVGENNPFYGMKHRDSTKKKISETKIRMGLRGERAHNYSKVKVECAQCGKVKMKIPYLVKRSENQFCSIKCFGKWKSENNVGENNGNWNHELTEEERTRGRKYPEYYEFVRAVLERDRYECVICGSNEKVNVHHIDSYDWAKDKRTDINNGITLCKEHHMQFHKEYGYGKNTSEQFSEFIANTEVNENTTRHRNA